MKNRLLKGLVICMGLLTILSGLLGCTKDNNPQVPQGGDEFGETGEDFNKEGTGKYKKATVLYFNTSGYSPGVHYTIQESEEKSGVTVLNYEDSERGIIDLNCEVSDDTMKKLSELLAELNIESWDKFSKSADDVLDGEGFSLQVCYEDGTIISAHGSNCFPKNYNEFVHGIADVLEGTIEEGQQASLEQAYKAGEFSELEFAMINYKDRGLSGDDSYSFLIRDSGEYGNAIELDVKSVSGDFIEPGEYKYYGDFKTAKLLSEIQEVIEKYEVYKWSGYDKSTDDYNDREWFQLSFDYPGNFINCCGCGDTEHYEEVRKELLEVVIKNTKDVLKSK